MAKVNHVTDVPGQPDWCTADWDYCGGGHPRCACCGGKGTAAQEKGEASAASMRQPGQPPPATRTAESPDAPTR
jgi:hypothetical protein